MNYTRKVSGVIIVCAAAFFAAGCETAKGFAGLSTKVLEDGRARSVKKTVPIDVRTCYERAERSLRDAGSYIYARNRDRTRLAAYLSESDTTPVGVFLTAQDGGTLVEVTSPSAFIKDAAAERLFKDLEKPYDRQTAVTDGQ